MGGSQLTQLKTSLREAGLSRTSAPKDAKKRRQQKNLSSASFAHRSSKLEAIGQQFNKFDVREEKKKFEVVTRNGRTEQGKKGAPGKSRAAGIELRKKTLLPLLEGRHRESEFVDRRFGENSTTLTPEEKALERFTAERTSRLSKKARFNLEDGDDEGGLTHGGRKLGFGDEDELEAGGWGGLGAASDSNREPLLRRRMAEAQAEGEDDDEPQRKRTRAEIMNEVVAKSKAYKAERQKLKSADDETRLALDQELKGLRFILGGSGTMPKIPGATTSQAAGGAKDKKFGDEGSGAGSEEDSDEAEEEEDDEEESEDDEEIGEDEDGEDESDEEEELDDAGLEEMLAASGKSGVDRDLLRKLIGKLADDPDSGDDEEIVPDEPVSSAAPALPTDASERPAPAPTPLKDDDPYDSYVRMLALEPRAQATNRLKTPVELAQEAAKELREREEARLRRERGIEDPASDEEAGKSNKRKRKPEADDLDDDFLKEEYGSDVEGSEGGEVVDENGLGQGLEVGGDESEEDDDEDDDEEENEDEDEGSDNDDDFDDDGEEFGGIGSDLEEDGEAEPEDPDNQVALVATVSTSDVRSTSEDGKSELPFTFPCPATHAEFVNLLSKSGISRADTATVVKRIRVLYHPGLGEANKGKLQTFTNVLLDHVLHLAASDDFATVNSLLPNLLTLSHAYPLTTAPHYVEKLSLMQKNFVRGIARGSLDPAAKTWPGAVELTLLRLIGTTWSTSDLSHPVAAGALLLIGEYLSQCRIRSLVDISSGLFLCTLAAQYESLSKRLVPEALNFLCNALLILAPSSVTPKNAPGSYPTPDLGQEHVKGLKLRTTDSLEPLTLEFGASLDGSLSTKQQKVSLIATSLSLLLKFAEQYVSLDAFAELFRPVHDILNKLIVAKLPQSLRTRIENLQANLARMLKLNDSSRQPLALQSHKPIPIATYIPKFDEGFNPNRRFDPDSERAEASKLRSLYKKEKKGAIRELRKDNKFLAGEEQRIKKAEDVEYQKKISKIMGSLQDERAEEKAFNSAKTKAKKQDRARRK
ncbi:Nop14-like protein [Meredithblackwellia eburnea MCA 4105]